MTTDVGGVPEVLPPHMAYLAKPNEKSIIRQIRKAVVNVRTVETDNFYNEVASIYSWRQVAERTERVYDYAMAKPEPNVMSRVKTSFSWGPVIGLWAIFYTIIEGIVMMLADTFLPEQDIDIGRSFDHTNYNIDPLAFGNHEFYVNPTDLRDKNKKPEQIIIDQNFKNTKLPGYNNHKNRYRTLLHPSDIPAS